jgi:hypothetical protein
MLNLFAARQDLELLVGSLSIKVVFAASAIIILLILYAAISGNRSHIIFGSIALSVILASLFLIGSTIYLNQASVSKGPVHHHADFEIWACGQQLELQNPQGFLSNKIGTPVLHEHNDKRIHLEGVIVNREDASLGKFFRVIGGELSASSLVVPTNDGKRSFLGGQKCNGRDAQVQVFAYRVEDDKKHYTLQKITDPGSFTITDDANVPPGDCIIVEFDTPKDRTDKMCRSWQVAKDIGRLRGEVR